MSFEKNVQIVKTFLTALGRRDKEGLLALSAEDIEWIIPGEDWPLPARTAGTRDWRIYLRRLTRRWKLRSQSPRVHSPGRPGSGRRLRYGENQSHEYDVRGPLGLRHYRSKWQTDEHPGVYRHASTGAGLRDGREPQGLTHRDRYDTKRFVKSMNMFV